MRRGRAVAMGMTMCVVVSMSMPVRVDHGGVPKGGMEGPNTLDIQECYIIT